MKRILSLAVLLVAGSGSGLVRGGSITLSNAFATFSQDNFDISNVISSSIDVSKGWAIDPREKTPQYATFGVSANAATSPVTQFTFSMLQAFTGADGKNGQHLVGDFRFSVTNDGINYFDFSDVSFSDAQGESAIIDPATGEILVNGIAPATSTYTVKGDTTLQDITGIRLDVIPKAVLPEGATTPSALGGSGRQPTNGNFVLTHLDLSTAAVTPLPSSALGGIALLGGLGVVSYRRSRMA